MKKLKAKIAAKENNYGYWIMADYGLLCICSNCGNYSARRPFCPYCGIPMKDAADGDREYCKYQRTDPINTYAVAGQDLQCYSDIEDEDE